MRRTFSIVITALLVAAACFSVAACGGKKEDYGTLTIQDMTLVQGESSNVIYQFSDPDKAEEITYSFDGNDIDINNDTVTALVGGKTVEVTAKTEHHETTFTVTTIIDYGTLVINDMYAWVDYPVSELDVIFEYPEYKEDLTYSYDETKLYINETNKTVEALAPGDFTVNVSSEHFKTTFTVHAEVVDKTTAEYDTSSYNAKVAGYLSDW